MKHGGYQIINLHNQNITSNTPITEEGVYNKIEGCKKPILVSGLKITISSTDIAPTTYAFKDFFAEMRIYDSKYVFKAPTGTTIAISDNDEISIILDPFITSLRGKWLFNRKLTFPPAMIKTGSGGDWTVLNVCNINFSTTDKIYTYNKPAYNNFIGMLFNERVSDGRQSLDFAITNKYDVGSTITNAANDVNVEYVYNFTDYSYPPYKESGSKFYLYEEPITITGGSDIENPLWIDWFRSNARKID